MIRVIITSIGWLCIAVTVCPGQSVRPSRRPAAAMISLTNALAGTWSTIYEFTPGAPAAADSTGRGEEVWQPGPGGFTLLEEEHVSTASGERFLLAIQWWDDSTQSLRGMLCNNSGAEACDVRSYANSTLSWDGRGLVVDLRFVVAAKQMLWHEVWSNITPTSFTQTGDVGEVGGTLKRVMTIHATRVAGASREPAPRQ